LRGKLFDDLNDARCLDPGIDPRGAGPGGLATDVDDLRACGGQCQTVGDGGVGIQVAPAIRERIVGDVQNAHDLHRRGLTYAG